jgi:NAD(P)-dependent dehydrogenase (short-subunit alcohol dehydrogenase family)
VAYFDDFLAQFDYGDRTAIVHHCRMSKIWLITGTSRGLGRALAKTVLAAGDRLVATSRNPEDLRAFVAEHGDRVRTIALDVTDPAAARDAVAMATSAFGRLDVVVNNAGYANVNSIEDAAEDDFRVQFETNYFGVVNVTRAALPVLRAQRDGHIIQVSSIGGRLASPGLASYQSAKWAVGGFSEILAKEVGPLGIRVTVVEPGGMRTDWAGSSMRIDDIQGDYQATVGTMAGMARGNNHIARSDPAKVAKAMYQLTLEKEPPVRLVLGSDAVFLAELSAAQRAREDAKWDALSRSTDFDGLGDFAETPIAKSLMTSNAG